MKGFLYSIERRLWGFLSILAIVFLVKYNYFKSLEKYMCIFQTT